MSDDLAYRRPVPVWWWLKKPSYFIFVMRELSSLFIAWFVLYLCLFVRSVARGPETYDDFLDWATTPWVVVVNVVGAIFLVVHTVTWFSLTPKAMVLQVRGQKVPAAAIIGAQYVGLALVSAVIFWLVLR